MERIISVVTGTLSLVKDAYYMYWGTAACAGLFLVAMLCIFLWTKKEDDENRQNKAIFWLVVVIGIVIFCPASAWFIMKYCVESGVYRRMFWVIPIPLLVGYVGAKAVSMEKNKFRKWFVGIFVSGIIVMCGTSLYTNGNFQRVDNPYKFWNGIVEVCDAIEADAEATQLEEIRAIGIDEFAVQARQYSAAIHMPYGRDGVRGAKLGKLARKIYTALHGTSVNAQALAFYAKQGSYQYLVYYAQEDMIPVFEEAGYEWLTQAQGYYIFKLNQEKVSDILITQYGQNEGSQSVFYTIETIKGKLIVIDGGYETDAAYVRGILKEKGNKVNAWILTHFHQDHIGAFCRIQEDPQGIKIKKIYTIDMAPMDLCVENAPWDETYTYERFLELDVEVTKYLYAGDKVKIAGVPMTIMNAYDDYVDALSDDLHNDGSLMFMVYGETEKMLFCSDIGKRMSDYLLESYGEELKADYLQMGHHGNGGLKADFYQMVNPKVALFDAPAWLFDNTDGTYTSAENREIITELGASVYSFDGAPHSFQLH